MPHFKITGLKLGHYQFIESQRMCHPPNIFLNGDYQ